MVRILVAMLHAFFALGFVTEGFILLAQARVNIAWEEGFYGAWSDGTGNMLAGAILALGLGAVQGSAALLFALGRRFGAHAIVAVSLLLLVVLQFPLSLAMAMTAGVGLIALLPRRAEGDPEEPRKDEE
jgi:hypothetical protein